ncbi:Uncharacterized protein dnl_37050 [Desulfonema limicola]|uniref:Uncharacterized protein n=1 Tax=Desulfonema limicola TaxID=45656 RepID=A0A975GHH1_9BACT|nr:Uncharacterized protein dnl_37050 [Desulfonema limicola]
MRFSLVETTENSTGIYSRADSADIMKFMSRFYYSQYQLKLLYLNDNL